MQSGIDRASRLAMEFSSSIGKKERYEVEVLCGLSCTQ